MKMINTNKDNDEFTITLNNNQLWENIELGHIIKKTVKKTVKTKKDKSLPIKTNDFKISSP